MSPSREKAAQVATLVLASTQSERVKKVLEVMRECGFTIWDFIDSYFSCSNPHISLEATKLTQRYGSAIIKHLYRRDRSGITEVIMALVGDFTEGEITTLTGQLSCLDFTSVSSLLKQFAQMDIVDSISVHVPVIWELLKRIVISPHRRHSIAEGMTPRRDHRLVRAFFCINMSSSVYTR